MNATSIPAVKKMETVAHCAFRASDQGDWRSRTGIRRTTGVAEIAAADAGAADGSRIPKGRFYVF